MELDKEILINQFGQGLLPANLVQTEVFSAMDVESKRNILQDIHNLVIQSKVSEEDVDVAIKEGNLKPTYTPCVILKKGLSYNNFQKVVNLPENELDKAFSIFLHLFKVGYYRRFLAERGNPDKWWYWDLSNEKNLDKIKSGKYRS